MTAIARVVMHGKGHMESDGVWLLSMHDSARERMRGDAVGQQSEAAPLLFLFHRTHSAVGLQRQGWCGWLGGWSALTRLVRIQGWPPLTSDRLWKMSSSRMASGITAHSAMTWPSCNSSEGLDMEQLRMPALTARRMQAAAGHCCRTCDARYTRELAYMRSLNHRMECAHTRAQMRSMRSRDWVVVLTYVDCEPASRRDSRQDSSSGIGVVPSS